jgi:hypothetical protein
MIGLLTGCATMPPTMAPSPPRRGIQPRSYKMKVAVFNFVDQTGSAGKLIQTIPDILATELYNTGRFELKERAELREIDPAQNNAVQEQNKLQVDTFLVGSITQFSVDEKIMTLDVRAINAFNGTVMYAGGHNVRYTGVLEVKVNRDDIKLIAEDIEAEFPELGDPSTQIISMSGDAININLGRDHGAKVGMACLVISSGDTISDPSSGESLAQEVYVGEAYIVEVQEKTSKAIVADNPVSKPRPFLHDRIRFK